MDILALLQCLQPSMGATSLHQLSQIIQGMLAMTGRVTMLGISRWTGPGGSYRTIQRFFATALPWATLMWVFFREHLWRAREVYLLAGDEVVVTKSGKQTYGLERFFSSLHGQSVSGLSFFTLSLVGVKQRHSFPLRVEQILWSEEEKERRRKSPVKKKGKRAKRQNSSADKSVSDTAQPAAKNRGGRPKGSRTQNKAKVELSDELLRIKGWIQALLKQLGTTVPVTYLLLDGHFGHNKALQMARQVHLHLISKLRYDSALYLPYENPTPERKCRRKYGERFKLEQIPKSFLKTSNESGNYRTDIYQTTLLHKEFAQALNVVIIVKTHRTTFARSHVLLFSSDLNLPYDQLMDYYSLRFQIEFNFRDAKQFWGLEDFMNVTSNGVTQAANLAFFMVNLSYYLMKPHRGEGLCQSVLELKSIYRGYKYVEEMIKLLPEKPEPVLLAQICTRISSLGRIHKVSTERAS